MLVKLATDGLPGAELVEQGLLDLAAGRESEQALLVRIAAPRLRPLGLEIPDGELDETPAEHRLYMLLSSDPTIDAYSRYRALLARMASFAAAAEHATAR